MLKTLASCTKIAGTPILIKNAWNCFRIRSLSEMLPRAFFIWIRRDIVASSSSDLSARYVVQESPDVWNSATPWNHQQLRKRPYWEQVVENQYEFNKAVQEGLDRYARDRNLEIWYEDLRANPNKVLDRIGASLTAHFGWPVGSTERITWSALSTPNLSDEDARLVETYAQRHRARLKPLFHPSDQSPGAGSTKSFNDRI